MSHRLCSRIDPAAPIHGQIAARIDRLPLTAVQWRLAILATVTWGADSTPLLGARFWIGKQQCGRPQKFGDLHRAQDFGVMMERPAYTISSRIIDVVLDHRATVGRASALNT